MDNRTKNTVVNVVGFCGGGVFFVLNYATKGAVPGGFVGGVLGYLLFGGLAAFVVHVLVPTTPALSAAPAAQRAGATAVRVAEIRALRALPAAFDRERFGLNVLVGGAYFVAQLLMQFTWTIPALLQGHSVGLSPARYYLMALAFGVLDAVAFVVVLHYLRSARVLPIVWGLTMMVLGVLARVTWRALEQVDGSAADILAPLSLLSGFAYGLLFMLGLVLAVHVWGPRLWSLMAGAAAGFVVHALVFQAVWSATRPGHSFSWEHPVTALLDGVILGGLVYAGLALHVRRLAAAVSSAAAAQ